MILIVNKNDFHYSFNTRGYMIYYQNNPIGGAGISKEAVGCRANLKLFEKEAKDDISNILNGYGQNRYYEEIKKIQNKNKGEIKWENII